MKVKIFIERRNESKSLVIKEKTTVSSLLEKLNINPVESVISKNNEIVTEGTIVEDGDDIKIFSVISGG